MFVVCIRTEFHIPRSDGQLFTSAKAKQHFLMATMLVFTLQKDYVAEVNTFYFRALNEASRALQMSAPVD